MKVYKIELCYVDHDDCGDDIVDMIEGANLGNHVYPGKVMSIQSAEIGEWDDDHPLNKTDTMKDEYTRLFSRP